VASSTDDNLDRMRDIAGRMIHARAVVVLRCPVCLMVRSCGVAVLVSCRWLTSMLAEHDGDGLGRDPRIRHGGRYRGP
jgi:hypothetical protein